MNVYELYYWNHIPGRGEFVRLVLAEVGASYRDVAREEGNGVIMAFYEHERPEHPVFAPPILKDGELVIAQVANICQYLAIKHGLVEQDLGRRALANQLQLTIADAVMSVHDTHHPLGKSLYYEEQKEAAKERARFFTSSRLEQWLEYFAKVLEYNRGDYLLGGFTYPDLSLFQLLEGIHYAFPEAYGRVIAKYRALDVLRERVRDRERIAAYLRSPARQNFNEDGIFRRYPELDE